MYAQQIATHYEHIFPAAPKVPFLAGCFKQHHRLLDVGCSDGRVASALHALGHSVQGIDLSTDMIKSAEAVVANAFNSKASQAANAIQSTDADLNVEVLNMLDVADRFGTAQFDGLYCIGNTLVHLPDQSTVREALSAFHRVLKPDGRLMLQILNYAKILERRPSTLPLIDNDHVRFERSYSYPKGPLNATEDPDNATEDPDNATKDPVQADSHIVFSTRLTVKAAGEVAEGATELLALTKDQLTAALLSAGFKDLEWFSDYGVYPGNNMNGPLAPPYNPELLPLIVVATA